LFLFFTILSASSGERAAVHSLRSHSARIQTTCSSVLRITGMAFGWIGSTTAFGDVVRKPWGPRTGIDFEPRSPFNVVQMPAKAPEPH
jgi:hypothetical protein